MGEDGVFIIGFDILPSHSASSKKAPKFACVITRNEVVLNEYPEISRGALLKLVREVVPKWLCTDNIFEIVPDTKSLFHLVDRIPTDTKIVQVTGVPPHQTPLKILAKRHGLISRGKLSPLESARQMDRDRRHSRGRWACQWRSNHPLFRLRSSSTHTLG